MSETDNLGLPYIQASQSQKHVTHNEALRMLDMLVHASVVDRNLSAPPVSPTLGDIYIVADNATNDWAGHENELVAYQDGIWIFQPIRAGQVIWVHDETVLSVWDGTGWLDFETSTGSFESLAKLGINATADTTNKLSVASDSILFNHDGGDIHLKINKNSSTDTASLLFQTGFSGRAELGLAGDDNFLVKVSSDGVAFDSAVKIGINDAIVSTPKTPAFSCVGNTVGSSGTPLKFHSVFTNNGTHYDNSTGRFTAPVDGMYQFILMAASAYAYAGNVAVKFYKNDTAVGASIAYTITKSNSYDYASGNLLLELDAGDYIDVRCTKSGALYVASSAQLSSFSGFLVG